MILSWHWKLLTGSLFFYAGKTVEEAPVSDFRSEETLRHPYTKALWRALPQNGFTPLDGTQPYVKDMPQGCPLDQGAAGIGKNAKGEIPMVEAGCGSVEVYPVLYVKRKYHLSATLLYRKVSGCVPVALHSYRQHS